MYLLPFNIWIKVSSFHLTCSPVFHRTQRVRDCSSGRVDPFPPLQQTRALPALPTHPVLFQGITCPPPFTPAGSELTN